VQVLRCIGWTHLKLLHPCHPQERNVGLGWMDMIVSDRYNVVTLRTTGYPGDKPYGTQWTQTCRVNDWYADDTITINECDGFPGQSGSPAYQDFPGNRLYIRGVFSFSSPRGNGFMQMTSARVNDAIAWRNGESHSSLTASGQTGGQTAHLATVYVLLQNSTPQLHLLALFPATLPS